MCTYRFLKYSDNPINGVNAVKRLNDVKWTSLHWPNPITNQWGRHISHYYGLLLRRTLRRLCGNVLSLLLSCDNISILVSMFVLLYTQLILAYVELPQKCQSSPTPAARFLDWNFAIFCIIFMIIYNVLYCMTCINNAWILPKPMFIIFLRNPQIKDRIKFKSFI